ncbi:MAG TPA: hypothetical protein VJV03_04650 [Pyrinomonadaceae bacterium]|nr:hypothetical protein [Pyrinomonadaceae bacterium]
MKKNDTAVFRIPALNYFNYFTEIEDAFIRRRDKHLLLSPMDWALIESWKEMDVPLHVVLRAIEKAFDSWESKPRKRTVKSLLYCQEEVEAQFAEWREAQVGAGSEEEVAEADERQPFSRTAILEHLHRGHAALRSAREKQTSSSLNEFAEVLDRAVARMEELTEEFSSTNLDARKLEQSLSGVERMLSDVMTKAIDADKVAALKAETKEQLRPYRKQMETTVYQQTLENLFLKRLREQYGVPRLSLFYL